MVGEELSSSSADSLAVGTNCVVERRRGDGPWLVWHLRSGFPHNLVLLSLVLCQQAFLESHPPLSSKKPLSLL